MALLLAVLATAMTRLGPWWARETRAILTSRDAAQAELDRVIDAIDWARGAGPAIDEAKARFDRVRPRLLGGGPADRGTRSLLPLVSDAADVAGLTVDEISELALREEAGNVALQPRRVRIVGSGDLTAIVALVVGVEGGGALLRIQRFVLSQPSVPSGESESEVLRFELVVEGLSRPEAKDSET